MGQNRTLLWKKVGKVNAGKVGNGNRIRNRGGRVKVEEDNVRNTWRSILRICTMWVHKR